MKKYRISVIARHTYSAGYAQKYALQVRVMPFVWVTVEVCDDFGQAQLRLELLKDNKPDKLLYVVG